jgi:Spy/CpxP family protein refolding chaperone
VKAKHRITLALAILALGVQALMSQEPAGSPPSPPDPATMAQHRVQFLTDRLSLTSQQQQQALTIFTGAATSQSGLHESMKTAHDSLRSAIKNNDANGISQAANTLANLTAQATVTQAKADAALYAILTPDQQTKLSQMEAHRPGMGHGGPGGFRRP